jgi:hypothetical protein
MIIRKGGIRETGNRFKIPHPSFLLSATYEHQQYELLKEQYARTNTDPSHHKPNPNILVFNSFATVEAAFLVSDPTILRSISPFHIWSDAYAERRLRWRPTQSLTVMILRVYTLLQAHSAPMLPEYRGCKSWLELRDPIGLGEMKPALPNDVFAETTKKIRNAVSEYEVDFSKEF